MNTATELVPSISITNLANQRTAVVERVRQALDLLGEAQELAKAAHLGFPRLVLDESYGCRGRPSVTGDYARRDEAEAAMVRIVDIRGWDYLLTESGLRTFMDAKAREQWSNQIAEGDIPELTVSNIEATFGQLYGARGEMFERGVLECFRRLSWNYKTHTPFKFGTKIIARALLRDGFLNQRVTNELDDLIRAFCVLDGKPEPDHRLGVYALVSQAKSARLTQAEHEYFSLRWFKNGNGHLIFKRPDLVDKMNLILAKHYPNALPSRAR